MSGQKSGSVGVYKETSEKSAVNKHPIADHKRVRPPFSWFGSKSRHLKFIGPLLPEDCKSYVEPFGGSASILLSRPPVPIETYNDLNGELVNFFRVLRDPELFAKFERQVDLTPFARSEFKDSLNIPAGADPVEKARLFFFRASVAYAGRSGLGHCYFTTTRTELRRGIPDRISRYLSAIDNLSDVASRFKTVQIENMDALELIKKYDTPETLFYCDPPYLQAVRQSVKDYDVEISDVYHRNLSDVLKNVKGRVAISGYDSHLYNTLFSGWMKHTGPINRVCENHAPRREFVWTNYDPLDGHRFEIVPDITQTSIKSWSEVAPNV